MGMGYNPYGQPNQYYGGMNPYYAQYMMPWMRRQPVVPAPEPSMVAKLTNRPAYQLNAPTSAQMFPGLMASLQSRDTSAPIEGSSGAGRFVGLLGKSA